MNGSWKYGTLNDVVKKESSNISLNKINNEEGEYPVSGAKGFVKHVSFFQQEQEYLAIIKDGAGIGRVSKHPKKSSILATMQYLIPKEGFEINFVKYFLSAIDFEKYRVGSTIPHIYFKDYKAEPFPLLSPLEQKRIVAILDEAFEGIDKVVANTKKNLANARELFESYLNNIFTQKGDGWNEKRLGDVCNIIGGGTPSKKNEDFYKGEIPWATVRDMKEDEIIQTDFKITKDAVKSSSTNIIKANNVVIATRVGLGKVCLVNQDTAINQDLRGVVPINSDSLTVRFLFWWLKSIAHLIEKEGTGATVQGVKLPFVKSLWIPLPTLLEQKRIVAKLDALRVEAQRLEAIYQQKLTALTELKQSLLQRAFTGELTAEDKTVKVEAVA